MRAQTFFWMTALVSAGCIQDLLDAGAALSPDTDTTSSSGTTAAEMPTPTTSGGSGVQTVTGLSGEADGTSGTTAIETTETPEPNAPPMVELLAVPDHLGEAGKAFLQLEASADVVKVRLSLDGAPLAELTPADFPYVYEALSAKDNGTPHVFTVEVDDAEGLTATDDAELTVLLPPSGAQKCLFTDSGAVSSVISALVYTDEAIVAVGARDTGAGYRATIWKLDPDHCEVVLPGWPKSLADWTAEPAFAALPSRAAAVDVDQFGNLAVGINLTSGGVPQRYVAFLTADGARLWEKPGKIGEEVAGVAITPETVVAVGWGRTNEDPIRTDAMLWRHLEGGGVWPTSLKAPFTPDEVSPDLTNQWSEWARAVLYDSQAGVLVVVGDRELKTADNKVYRRGFVARFAPLGGKFGLPWTSTGDPLLNDGINAITRCGGDILLGGWAQDWLPGSLPTPLTRWLDPDGTATARVVESMAGTQTFGIGCDREGKVVHGAMRVSGQLDAQVFAFQDPKEPRLWYDAGSPGNDGAGAVRCDSRGFCAWGGFRTLLGKTSAVLRAHHP